MTGLAGAPIQYVVAGAGLTPKGGTTADIVALFATLGITSSATNVIYDARYNATTTSWADYYGNSAWGALSTSGNGGGGGFSAPTLSGSLYTVNGTTQGLISATQAGALESPTTLVVVGGLTGGNNLAACATNLTGGMSVGVNSSSFWQARIMEGGTSYWGETAAAIGSTIHMAVVILGSPSSTSGSVTVPNQTAATMTAGAAQGANTAYLSIGCQSAGTAQGTVGFGAGTVAALMMFASALNGTQISALQSWAQTYHAAVAA